MDKILIRDCEVFYRVGVPELERSNPQRLLISLELHLDFSMAADTDDLGQTVDYAAVCLWLQQLGREHSWRLLERLALDIIEGVKSEFGVAKVRVEIQKFILPGTRFVGVEAFR